MDTQQKRQDIWAEPWQVRFSDIDRSDRLTLASVFNFFQETAINHAENLGVGRDSMEKTGQVWLLSRISVQVDRRPQYRENIIVRSWPRGGEKLFAMRDYDIRDASDVPVVRGRSGWLVIDMEKRRPLRPQSIMDALPQNTGIDALSATVGLAARTELQKTAERPAAYSDLDYNGHVNNVSYIKWIEDALDPKLLEGASQMRLDINYLNETFPGESVAIWTAPIEAARAAADSAAPEYARAFAFEGRRSGEQAVFRAELRLSEK